MLHSESLHLHSYLNTITLVHSAGTDRLQRERRWHGCFFRRNCWMFPLWWSVALHCTKWGWVIVELVAIIVVVVVVVLLVSGVVHLPQLHHDILRGCSILPFVFYCPFICLHWESLSTSPTTNLLFVNSFFRFFFSVNHLHTNVSNISEFTHNKAYSISRIETL